MNRKLLYFPLVVLFLAGAAAAATIPVDIIDLAFSPESVTVAAGDTVVWTNSGALPHTTTSGTNGTPDSLWDSGTLTNGQSFSRAFLDVGSFPYFCRFHYLGGMTGVVNVSPSGVEEEPRALRPSDVRLFPNPATRGGRVSLALERAGEFAVRLVDVQGRVVFESPGAVRGPGRFDIRLPVPAGVYYLDVSDGGVRGVAPLVVAD